MGTNGTTSACAENTCLASRQWRPRWNYLRVRGEYKPGVFLYAPIMELPPRARRILNLSSIGIVRQGTTSACAENTPAPWASIWNPWNYLRVRGEYLLQCLDCVQSKELPPRARRIRLLGVASVVTSGTTSACAENTLGTYRRPYIGRNYLRVRGEYFSIGLVPSGA